jgi:hypothetical protein
MQLFQAPGVIDLESKCNSEYEFSSFKKVIDKPVFLITTMKMALNQTIIN